MDYKQLILERANTVRTECKRKGVACGVVYKDKVKWFSNGPINDDSGLCSGERGNCGCIHAEQRAIAWAIRWRISSPFDLLVNYSPCINCANTIVVSGCIDRVYYITPTEHDLRGIKHLEKAGIEVVQL